MATDRLSVLYEISTLLARFQSVEQTVPAVLAMLSRSLPLRAAILTRKGESRSHTLLWQPPGQAHRLGQAKAHAARTYAYLGLELGQERAAEGTGPSDSSPSLPSDRLDDALRGTFLVLPMALAEGTIFGAMLLECVTAPDEAALMFANVVVNHVAIALDRHERVEMQVLLASLRRESAESSEKTWRFLAEVSSVLAGSFDFDATLASLARLAVPTLGEVCFVDLRRDDGSMRRVATVFADGGTFAAVRDIAVVPGVAAVASDATAHAIHGQRFHASGLQSMLVVPLADHEAQIGAITLLSSQAHRYTAGDVALAEEVARRTTMTFNNAVLYAEAQAAVQAREELLEIVSHDLKNPLGVMKLILAMLLKERAGQQERRTSGRKQLEAMARAADRMTALVSDILDGASMNAGRFSVEARTTAVPPLVADVLEAALLAATRQTVHLTSEVAEDTPPIVADAARVQQVLANLLGNAIKFSPRGGHVVVHAFPSPGVPRTAVTFSVTDSGPGVAEEDRAHLFDRFWRAQATASMGTGLGLFIARTIVESHRGRIWFEPDAGGGSRFSFELPILGATIAP